MSEDANRRSRTEVWMAWVRLLAVPFAVLEVGLLKEDYPPGYQRWAWALTALLALGAGVLLWLAYRVPSRTARRRIGFGALVLDTVVVYGYVLVYSFEPGTPIRQLVFIPLIEAALRYGIVGALAMSAVSASLLAFTEWWREDRFPPQEFDVDRIVLPVGVQLILGLVVGSLVERLRAERRGARARVAEAETLRDELGRRSDILDATNRAARALGSSLDQSQAFAAFIRELRGLIAFERTAIILLEDGRLRVFAAAGEGIDSVFPPGTVASVEGSVVEDLVDGGRTIYRDDMSEPMYAEEADFVALGLRSRVVAPILSGAATIGAISVVRREPGAFSDGEIELLGLLGRLVGSALQNIRAYEAERTTVEELRRLSALRADFVSLVSHELRSPMASVIGSARTLEQRWRELSPEQRESFLALIAHETSRLAELIGDVLDTSRIESGTFSYSFEDVDLARLVRDSAAAAEHGQDEVTVEAVVREPLPVVRGDRDRLRQVLVNLIDNAVKYSPPGDRVSVQAEQSDSRVVIEVRDRGPGISPEHQRLIFEKFGRANVAEHAKPGTGLGLFIARSIAEAHGGALEVRSAPGRGATFRLSLPL
ncbi:MAG TPA: GAF domain-containing sensor histidine kinase [Actinomycetota bacterium]|nr:GAF domain-containing sensor histidine kinase [Actinomycetota bacterium]